MKTQLSAENEANSERNIPEGQSCVVCLGHQREVILMDCGHVCVCADCATGNSILVQVQLSNEYRLIIFRESFFSTFY